jgi:hypothetical protein
MFRTYLKRLRNITKWQELSKRSYKVKADDLFGGGHQWAGPGTHHKSPKISKNTKKYQKIPNNTKKYQKIPNNIRKYQKIPKNTKRY